MCGCRRLQNSYTPWGANIRPRVRKKVPARLSDAKTRPWHGRLFSSRVWQIVFVSAGAKSAQRRSRCMRKSRQRAGGDGRTSLAMSFDKKQIRSSLSETFHWEWQWYLRRTLESLYRIQEPLLETRFRGTVSEKPLSRKQQPFLRNRFPEASTTRPKTVSKKPEFRKPNPANPSQEADLKMPGTIFMNPESMN